MSVLKRMFGQPKIPSGRYTYRGKGPLAGLALQLRIEPDGEGILVINADRVLFLNDTATAFAYFFMNGFSSDEVLKRIRRAYRVDAETAKRDYENEKTADG